MQTLEFFWLVPSSRMGSWMILLHRGGRLGSGFYLFGVGNDSGPQDDEANTQPPERADRLMHDKPRSQGCEHKTEGGQRPHKAHIPLG